MNLICGYAIIKVVSTSIIGQYKTAITEKEDLKRRFSALERRFEVVERYLYHVKRMEKSREEVKRGKLIPQEKLFRELGL